MGILGGRVREELAPSEGSRSRGNHPTRELERQVRRARRRLDAQRLVCVLGWCWFATLLAASVLIVANRFRPLGVADWVWGAWGLGLGLLGAVVWTVVTGRGPMDAAIAGSGLENVFPALWPCQPSNAKARPAEP